MVTKLLHSMLFVIATLSWIFVPVNGQSAPDDELGKDVPTTSEILTQPANAGTTSKTDSSIVSESAGQGVVSPSTGTALKGSAEFHEYLPPLEMGWRTGSTFDTVILKKLTPNNVWHRIPSWAAGKWKMNQFTTFSYHQLKEQWRARGLNRSRIWRTSTRLGFQKDRDGGIWEFDFGDYIGSAQTEQGVAIGFVKQREIVASTDDKLVTHQVGRMIEVNSETRVITKATQYESMSSKTKAGNGLLKEIDRMREFDEDGKPECEYQNVCFLIQSASFYPIDVYDGRDMWSLFQEYLESHNMDNLVPIQHSVGLVARKWSPSGEIMQLLTEKSSRLDR